MQSCRYIVRYDKDGCCQRKKSIHQNRGTPPLSVCRPAPRSQRKKTMVYTISLKKTREKGNTIGPERRVYIIEAADPEKEKREGVVVCTFFFPVPGLSGSEDGPAAAPECLVNRPTMEPFFSSHKSNDFEAFPLRLRCFEGHMSLS